jgi:hypothetical protein
MDRRPKKLRPSDANRRNVNLNKCITKVVDAPTEYTIVSAEGYNYCCFFYFFPLK